MLKSEMSYRDYDFENQLAQDEIDYKYKLELELAKLNDSFFGGNSALFVYKPVRANLKTNNVNAPIS